MKIRGTASHVAEKYLQLARDAQSSGDPVAAENYYQHAEHYFRLIAAAQEQFRQSQPYYQQQPQGQPSAGGNGPDDGYDDGDDQPQIGEPFAPREQQPVYPQQNQQQQQQHNPYSQHHQYNQQNNHNQQNNQRPQHMQPESEQDVDRLPSFITGGQSQQPQQGQSQGGNGSDGSNGYDGSDRFQRHRRRRHRGPRDHVQGDHTLRGDNDAAMPPGSPQED